MAKATTTILQRLHYAPQHASWFAANQALFNRVVAFYFDVIQAHDQILQLGSMDALRALEHLTHATSKHPNPVLPLPDIGEDIPAMLRRAAINAALGSAKSFQGNLKRWRTRKAKRECARCGEHVIRYHQGWHSQDGYTVGAPLVRCPACQMRGHADRNASIVIGQRLFARYRHPMKQEKPPARRGCSGRVVKATGVIVSQDAQNPKQPSIARARHGDHHEHGTAQAGSLWMDERPTSLPTQLRLFNE